MRPDALRRRVLRLKSRQRPEVPPRAHGEPSIREHLAADDPVRFAQVVKAIARIDNSWTPCSRHIAERRVDEDEPGVDDFEQGVNLLRDVGLIENDCRWCKPVEASDGA